MSYKRNNNGDDDKFSIKDAIIVGLSVIALILLFVIVYLSRKNDEDIAQTLERESGITTGTTATVVKDVADYLMFSEVSSEGWIEFYVTGIDKLDLSGVKVYVSGELSGVIEEGAIVSKDKYVVVALKDNPGANKENIITVTDAEDNSIFTMLVPKLTDEKSYGRADFESEDLGFMQPTKGEANISEGIEYEEISGIGFSVPTGFYTSSFKLTLSAKEGEKIYYTTDGTIPTTESKEYTQPISVTGLSGGQAVYAIDAFEYFTSTKYIPASVDKGMVVNAIRVDGSGRITGRAACEYYIGLRKDVSYSNIPVVSLTTDPDNLFDYFNGIYVAGRTREDAVIQELDKIWGIGNYNNGWERNGKLAFFEPDKGLSLESDAVVKMHFNIDIENAQRAIEFKVSDDGAKLLSGCSLSEYLDSENKFVLEQFVSDDTVKVRKLLANSIMEGASVGTADITPVILFIEGEYWGVYQLQAPYDAEYIKRNYDITDEVYLRDYEGEYNQHFMDFYNFVIRNDMSDTENYSKVKEMMDVQSYLEYVCANMFFGTTDFRSTKTTVWRTAGSEGTGYSDGRWRWLMSPVTTAMANAKNQSVSIDTFKQPGVQLDRFFQSLLCNKDFCAQMETVMGDMLEGRLASENTVRLLEETADLMVRPSIDTYNRFYGSYSQNSYDAEIDRIRDFLVNRDKFITIYTKELAEKGGDLEYIDKYEEEHKDKNNNTQDEQDAQSTQTENGEM